MSSGVGGALASLSLLLLLVLNSTRVCDRSTKQVLALVPRLLRLKLFSRELGRTFFGAAALALALRGVHRLLLNQRAAQSSVAIGVLGAITVRRASRRNHCVSAITALWVTAGAAAM